MTTRIPRGLFYIFDCTGSNPVGGQAAASRPLDFRRISVGFLSDFRQISVGFSSDFRRIFVRFSSDFSELYENSTKVEDRLISLS